MSQKLRKMLLTAKSFIPERLPQSESAVLSFIDEVCELGALPNNNSFKQAIATALMHVGQDSTHVTKRSLLNSLRRQILNQASYNILQIIKDEEKAAKDATIKEAQ